MNGARATASASGIGVLGLLGVAFIVLKLLGIITWSWWWVTAPFWGPFALVLAIVLLVILGMFVKEYTRLHRQRRAARKAARS